MHTIENCLEKNRVFFLLGVGQNICQSFGTVVSLTKKSKKLKKQSKDTSGN